MESSNSFWGSMGRKLSVLGTVVGEKAVVAASAVKRGSIIAGKSATETVSQVASVASENIKQGFHYVGEGVAHVVDDVNKATLAVPQEVRCDKCSATVVVPPTTFHWVCMEGHVSGMSDMKCLECPATKPAEAKPTIICNSCQTSIVVPTSKIANGFRSTGLATSKLLDTTTSGARKQFQVLSSRPASFQCPFCLGNVTSPPWVCGTCQQSNLAAAVTCSQCTAPQSITKPVQKYNNEGWPVEADEKEYVTCPTCQKKSPIPTSALVASISATSSGIGVGLKKMFYSITDEPYVICAFCNSLSALKDVSAPGPHGQSLAGEAKGPPSEGITREFNAESVIGECSVCHHTLERDMIRQSVNRTVSQLTPQPRASPPPSPAIPHVAA